MKRNVIFGFAVLTVLAVLALTVNAKDDHAYKIYTPANADEVAKDVQEEKPDSQILFIVDFSNSMNDMIRGKTKVEIARTTLAEILPKIPKNVKTGLRVYGHKTGFTYVQGCTASNLTVPLAPNNARNILTSLYSCNASGWTPITYSLKQAIRYDFMGFSGKKHIILLTDGGENCDESPCTFVMELIKTRRDIFIDVIAFNIEDEDDLDQLECTALVTSGKFYTADTACELAEKLAKSLGVKKEVEAKIIAH